MKKCDKDLVSVIIPTYNRPQLFEIALKSVLNQTYKNIEIFISDNSPNTKTKDLIGKYLKKYDNIIYEHHPEYKCARDNWNRCKEYNNVNAEYVNWLMDDDVFMPYKIEAMLLRFRRYPQISMVTSYRQCVDINGNVLPDLGITRSVVEQETIIQGENAGKAILTNMVNFIGEPTTPLIKKSAMINGTLGSSFNAGSKYSISDFPTWLTVLQTGDLIYMPMPLSQFRLHKGQDQCNINMMINGLMRWGIEISYYWEKKIFLKEYGEYLQAFNSWVKMFEDVSMVCKYVNYSVDDKLLDMINMYDKLSSLRKV